MPRKPPNAPPRSQTRARQSKGEACLALTFRYHQPVSLPREFLYELHKQFTGEIRTDLASRILYSTDASIYKIEPLGVVIPRTQEELHAAVELAVKYKIPILPRGAGTSLAGQAVGEALILDCSRWLDQIVEINAEEKYAIAEPGVVLSDLNRAAAKHGLMFGPDPASAERATMGGVIANNATGAHSIVYGMSADHLLSADVILGDGGLATFDDSIFDNRYSVVDSRGSNTQLSKVIHTVHQIREKYTKAIQQNYPKIWRNSAGYRLNYLLPWSPSAPPQWVGQYPPGTNMNLAPLLAGSEGTLAVIRRMKVNLVPKPKQTTLAVLWYASVTEACDDVPRLLKHDPSAIELIPRTILRAARSTPAYSNEMTWLTGDPAALLVVEFSGDDSGVLLERAKRCGLDEVPTTRSGVLIAESRADQAQVWNVRKVGLGLMDSKHQPARPVAFIEDCAIPVERLGEYVREVERILAAHDTEGGMYAHASAGCLHIRPILDLKSSHGMTSLRSISEAVFALTLSLGGAMSSEHGDGLARSEHLARTYGSEVMDAMRLLKDAADPHRLFNPGKIIDAPKLDENLRYGSGYTTQAWIPELSFAREGGFELAVEQCNGQGVCRKTSGVMCPSYQGTREEMHSTRGRANLLRAAISGQWSAVSGERTELIESTFQALDLCLACKGCKAECPSGVDMAKLKYEFENEYYKTHRRPLRDYLFGYFHVAAGMLALIAPLANAVMNFPLTRKMIAKGLGLAEERPLPKFQHHTMSLRDAARALWRRSNLLESKQSVSEHEVASGALSTALDVHSLRSGRRSSQRHVVIFLPDVFSRYIEPQVEAAALEVLEACEYEVRVLPIVGAGASFLSKGMIEAAQRHAGKVLDMLDRADPRGEAVIVGLEPSEIYLLKNDYIDLLPDRAEVNRQLEGRVWYIDEFLVRSEGFDSIVTLSASEGSPSESGEILRRRFDFAALRSAPAAQNDMKIFFHPHCHQRAEGLAPDGMPSGANASVELLRRCGYEVELSDAGCCGLAGTFGYEAEHYELSMKIAELRLLPRIADRGTRTEDGGSEATDRGPSSIVRRPSSIASTGAACRMQIRHGAGTAAKHPIEWVREVIKRSNV
jgi:FAD/FMN-containing dehydrogenase/Fe-S oxidoreductase